MQLGRILHECPFNWPPDFAFIPLEKLGRVWVARYGQGAKRVGEDLEMYLYFIEIFIRDYLSEFITGVLWNLPWRPHETDK